MKIAFTIASGRGETNLLLTECAERLAARGLKLCGTVQVDTAREKDHACDMDVTVLPDGPVIRISQDLGAGSRGCRLDPAALEQAVVLSEAALVDGADLLIVNKFGKHEADGRGFRSLIAEALARDIPVLAGVNKLNRDAFVEFCGGEAVELQPDLPELLTWADARFADLSAA